jgi:hypothetical protein
VIPALFATVSRPIRARGRQAGGGVGTTGHKGGIWRLAAAAALGACLIAAAPAMGARAGYRVSEAALPRDADHARAILKRALSAAPAGSRTRADIS